MKNFKRILGFACGIVVALGAMIATVKMAYATEKPAASPVKYGVEEGVEYCTPSEFLDAGITVDGITWQYLQSNPADPEHVYVHSALKGGSYHPFLNSDGSLMTFEELELSGIENAEFAHLYGNFWTETHTGVIYIEVSDGEFEPVFR